MTEDNERSKDQQLQNRVYLTELYNPDDIIVKDKDLSYIAGLFDAEVALGIRLQGHSYSLRLSYMKTNRDILEFLSDIFGGTVRKVKPQPYYRFAVWQWCLTSGNAYRALLKLDGLLRIKKEAAAICRDFFELYWRPSGTGRVSEERQAVGAQLKSRLKEYQLKPGSGKISDSVPKLKRRRSVLDFPAEYVLGLNMIKAYRSPKVKLPELELAYIAGLLDAESSFIIYKLHNRPSYLLDVNYRKTNYDTLEYLAGIFGGRVRRAPRSSKNKRDVWLWKLTSVNAYLLLILICPLLRIKKESAELCIEFFEGYWQPRSTIPVSAERQAIGALYTELLKQHHTKSLPHHQVND